MNTRIAALVVTLIVALSSLAVAADDTATGVVNINTADIEALMLLPPKII